MGYLQCFHLQPHPINGRHSSSSAYWYYLKSLTIFCFLHYHLHFLPCYTAGNCSCRAPFLQLHLCGVYKFTAVYPWPQGTSEAAVQKAADPVCSALNTVLLLRRASTHPTPVSVLG